LECLDIVGTEAENPAWLPIVSRIYADVEQGALLAKALESFPAIFHNFYRRMVEVGETTGRLDESLTQLAVYLDKQAQLRAKIVSALAYPAVLVTVSLMVFVLLLVWVVPLFSGLFQEFGESLPWLTQVVIDLADGIREHGLVLVGLFVCLVLGGRIMLVNAKSRQIMDRILLRLPLVGTIFQKSAIVRFTRTLGFLVRRGVPLLTGLSVAATVTGNSVMEASITTVATEVQDGKPLSETLRASGVFPPMVTQMIKVGESTGSLDIMLEKIADVFEQEVDRVVVTMTSVLEPCVIVVVGSGIALVVVAMYLPIFSIGSIIG
jgi:type IV pilus assembly protein PilC